MKPLLEMTRAALIYNIRQPATLLFGFVMPAGIIIVLHIIGGNLLGAPDAAGQVVPGVLAYSVANASLSSSGLTLTAWRSSGLLARLRLQPVSAWEVIGARFLVSVMVTLLQGAVFVALGVAFLGLRPGGFFAVVAPPAIVLSGLVFFLIGGAVGMLARSQEAVSAGVNLILLPLGLLSGCFLPLGVLPARLACVMELTPLTATAQLLIGSAGGVSASSGLVSWAVLGVSAALAGLLFLMVYRWKTT
ncbi:ABC transporter permease [Actinomyces timonensis]|uniref:Transport permease protein n=1 Tax=Actinomyces timonensis TaxID=1288391 RepID=A0AAU8N300_9ACTO